MRIPVPTLFAATVLCLSGVEASAQFFDPAPPPFARGRRVVRVITYSDPVTSWFFGPQTRRVYVEVPRAPRHPRVARYHAPPRVRLARAPSNSTATLQEETPSQTVPADVPVSVDRNTLGELLVALKPGIDAVEGPRLARRHRLHFVASDTNGLLGTTIVRVHMTDQSPAEAMNDLATDDRVAFVQPNHLFTLHDNRVLPTMPAPQSAVETLPLGDARKLATGADVRIALIDSGIDGAHPDLVGHVDAPVDETGGAQTNHAHGTAMAGLIVGRGKLAGVAPDAQLVDIRAFTDASGKDDGATTLQLLHALDDAQAHGARLVQLDFTGPADALVTRALTSGRDKAMIFVAPVAGMTAPGFPASDPGVIAVTTVADPRVAGTSADAPLAMSSSADGLLTTAPGGLYAKGSGTSWSAAELTGLAALVLQIRPDLDTAALKSLLVKSARPDSQSSEAAGSRVVDPQAALTLAAKARDEATPEADLRARGMATGSIKDATPP
jgi:hypothetical protein